MYIIHFIYNKITKIEFCSICGNYQHVSKVKLGISAKRVKCPQRAFKNQYFIYVNRHQYSTSTVDIELSLKYVYMHVCFVLRQYAVVKYVRLKSDFSTAV